MATKTKTPRSYFVALTLTDIKDGELSEANIQTSMKLAEADVQEIFDNNIEDFDERIDEITVYELVPRVCFTLPPTPIRTIIK